MLTNFNTTASGGTSSKTAPFITTQTKLRVKNDEFLYYNYVPAGLNSSLSGMVYRVAELDGTPGTGGLLMVLPTRGTVVIFR